MDLITRSFISQQGFDAYWQTFCQTIVERRMAEPNKIREITCYWNMGMRVQTVIQLHVFMTRVEYVLAGDTRKLAWFTSALDSDDLKAAYNQRIALGDPPPVAMVNSYVQLAIVSSVRSVQPVTNFTLVLN